MDELKNLGLGNLSSMDDLDLAMMGLLPTAEEEPQEDGKPTISPFHDMDSLEFHLWMEEEVDKEAARRLAMKNTAKPAAADPEQK